MVNGEKRYEGWVSRKCPCDCPFRDKMPDHSDYYCSFALYADVLEPGRFTRTEITPDGAVNYHLWPDCDIYQRYKGLNNVIAETKRRRQIQHQMGLRRSDEPLVTAHKHPAISKHKGGF